MLIEKAFKPILAPAARYTTHCCIQFHFEVLPPHTDHSAMDRSLHTNIFRCLRYIWHKQTQLAQPPIGTPSHRGFSYIPNSHICNSSTEVQIAPATHYLTWCSISQHLTPIYVFHNSTLELPLYSLRCDLLKATMRVKPPDTQELITYLSFFVKHIWQSIYYDSSKGIIISSSKLSDEMASHVNNIPRCAGSDTISTDASLAAQ